MPLEESDSIAGLYNRMVSERQPFLDRGRDAASLTIPSLLPRDLEAGFLPGNRGHQSLPTPFQSVGARGTNNLATSLLLSLFPPGRSFMELSLNEAELQRETEDASVAQGARQVLLQTEIQVGREFDLWGMRVDLFESLKHLVNEGNTLLYLPPKGKLQIFHLDSYCTRYDPTGHMTELVYLAHVNPLFLPDEVRVAFEEHHPDWKVTNKNAMVYTYVFFADDDRYHVMQEVAKQIVPDSTGDWLPEDLPYMPLRLNRISGEHYGRGHTEEYIGDLKSLESLTKSIVEGAAAMAKIIFFKDPAGSTRMDRVSRARNGSFIPGKATDFSTLQVDKFGDFRVAMEVTRDLESRLSFAYLLNQAVQRQAERVTAEEIRFLARELEETLGGLYSILTQELQLPLARRIMQRLRKAGSIPEIPDRLAEPKIVTGLAALGREEELFNLQNFLAQAQAAVGPQVAAEYLNPSATLASLALGNGVANKDLIRSEADVQQARQAAAAQQAQAEAITKSAPGVAKEVAKSAFQPQAQVAAPPA